MALLSSANKFIPGCYFKKGGGSQCGKKMEPSESQQCQEPTSALNRNLIGKTKKENPVDLILVYDRSWIFLAQLCSMGI